MNTDEVPKGPKFHEFKDAWIALSREFRRTKPRVMKEAFGSATGYGPDGIQPRFRVQEAVRRDRRV